MPLPLRLCLRMGRGEWGSRLQPPRAPEASTATSKAALRDLQDRFIKLHVQATSINHFWEPIRQDLMSRGESLRPDVDQELASMNVYEKEAKSALERRTG